MNKMNENEAIEILKHVNLVRKFSGIYSSTEAIHEAIETILDLYNKEKDSNQWLLKAFDESRNNNIELAKEHYKLQEELKQEKDTSHHLQNELDIANARIVEMLGQSLNNSIDKTQKENERLEALNEGWKIELEKKDKIINAMTKEWFELDTLFMIRGKNIYSAEELKQYFERRAEDE